MNGKLRETDQTCMSAPTIESGDLLCRTLLDTADEIIFLKDDSFRYLIVNRALLDFFGRSEAEVLGRTNDELMAAETAKVCRATDEKALATGQVVIAEQTIGERIYETRKFPITLPGNRTGIVGYIKNITDRKRNEEALRESETRYRELAEMLPQVVFELDIGGYFTFLNKHSLALFGYAEEDLKSLNVVQTIAPEDRERAWRNFQLVLRGEPHADNEYTVLKKDGSRFPVIIYAVGIIRDGRPVGIRGLLVDITERKRTEEHLRDLGSRDHLTGLYNRAFFQEELDRLETGRRFPVSIVMADVDRLKEINDTEGHQAGDDRLRRTAEVLGTFRSEDVVARIGGDEFAVILPATDAATAEAVLQRVQESLADHNSRHPEKPLGLSFGVATGEKGVSLTETLQRADERMYRYKTGIRPEGGNPLASQGKRAPC
jgi:diguanylate cyclase (GGDEF)-like protein/PAS domain S-box-containing protein